MVGIVTAYTLDTNTLRALQGLQGLLPLRPWMPSRKPAGAIRTLNSPQIEKHLKRIPRSDGGCRNNLMASSDYNNILRSRPSVISLCLTSTKQAIGIELTWSRPLTITKPTVMSIATHQRLARERKETPISMVENSVYPPSCVTDVGLDHLILEPVLAESLQSTEASK
ncbi:uncharacterized protein BO66DRAFT_387097 [Aspergillus aculeatinus CBS 121060]|uniref:Uncharacterized protein n=1 Tax=Aspergillus aculeatinus CBS 121060 TaxID=1448322 RepID=A0ACD1HMR8_9EURO|nr:hypothetical protein BO66DRAFT_387097 [Aspergillus aculeatinus CBS 121060]RAH75159.1 hypothetical protein BO66DRAFT_387097 [Aspergillus aculeatinus CBS 121060]